MLRNYLFTALTPSGRHIPSNALRDTRHPTELSPAERVIGCSELVAEISQFFADTVLSKAEMFKSMVLSKSWFLAVVPHMWSDLNNDDVYWLLNLLNIRYFDYDRRRQLRGEEFLRHLQCNSARILASFQLPKALFYAEAVQIIRLNTTTVTPGTFAYISFLMQNTTSAFMCNLRELHWMEASAQSRDLCFVLTPSIERLEIQTFDVDDAQDSTAEFASWLHRVLEKIALVVPNLKSLNLEAFGMLDIPLALEHFTSIQASSVNHGAVHDAVRVVPSPVRFKLDRLTKLHMSTWSGPDGMFRCLSSICPTASATLRIINLQSLGDLIDFGQDSQVCFLSRVRPLLALHSLEVVLLNFPKQFFRFTDGDLRRMAGAWPRLVQLRISFQCEPGSESTVPELATLGFIAFSCPRLQSITVPALAGMQGGSGPYEITAPANHPLLEIRSQYMLFKDDRRDDLNAALARAFPNLLPYNSGYGCGFRYYEASQAVLHPYILQSMQTSAAVSGRETHMFHY